MATSPTQLSLKKLRAEGYLVSITEKFNHFCKIRQDMWGWCDLLAIKEDEEDKMKEEDTPQQLNGGAGGC